MSDFCIHSVQELRPIIEDIQNERFLSGYAFMEFYRGLSISENKLIPGIFRCNIKPDELPDIELSLFNQFVKESEKGNILLQDSYLENKYPYSNNWVRLFQAQHLGLKTRLLDWTISWEMALLFAVENGKYHEIDGKLWIFKCPRDLQINNSEKEVILTQSPFEIDNFYMINFPFFYTDNYKDQTAERRRARQHGRFSIQPQNEGHIPIEEQKQFQPYLIEIKINGDSKKRILEELAVLGINLDRALYRKEENIDKTIKEINTELTK